MKGIPYVLCRKSRNVMVDEERIFMNKRIAVFTNGYSNEFIAVGPCPETETIEEYIDRADKYMYSEKEKYHQYIDSINPQV